MLGWPTLKGGWRISWVVGPETHNLRKGRFIWSPSFRGSQLVLKACPVCTPNSFLEPCRNPSRKHVYYAATPSVPYLCSMKSIFLHQLGQIFISYIYLGLKWQILKGSSCLCYCLFSRGKLQISPISSISYLLVNKLHTSSYRLGFIDVVLAEFSRRVLWNKIFKARNQTLLVNAINFTMSDFLKVYISPQCLRVNTHTHTHVHNLCMEVCINQTTTEIRISEDKFQTWSVTSSGLLSAFCCGRIQPEAPLSSRSTTTVIYSCFDSTEVLAALKSSLHSPLSALTIGLQSLQHCSPCLLPGGLFGLLSLLQGSRDPQPGRQQKASDGR